jgi:hypothetical protein
MTAFFQDTWQDLREKNLWPVAILLVAGLIAVPVLLFQPAKDAKPADESVAQVDPKAKAMLAIARGGGDEESSDLGVFDPRDPFRAPPSAVPKASTTPGTTSTSTGGASSSLSGATASGGGSGSSEGDNAGVSGGGGPAQTGQGTSSTTTTTRKTYTYVVDLRFGERGEVRSRKGVRRLTLLPSSRNPLLVFLGVTDDRRKAVFLVESGLSQEGEGTCKPSKRYCSFLYLRTADSSDDHYFSTSSGKQYALHLSRIRRVEVKRKKKRARPSAKRRPSPGTSPGAIFEAPILVDEQR